MINSSLEKTKTLFENQTVQYKIRFRVKLSNWWIQFDFPIINYKVIRPPSDEWLFPSLFLFPTSLFLSLSLSIYLPSSALHHILSKPLAFSWFSKYVVVYSIRVYMVLHYYERRNGVSLDKCRESFVQDALQTLGRQTDDGENPFSLWCGPEIFRATL